MTRTALDIAQSHVDRIAREKAAGRERLATVAPDLLELADALRAVFGSGVKITRMEMKHDA